MWLETFNNSIGDLSASLLYTDRCQSSVQFEWEKAHVSYNIKAAVYNIVTITTIAAFAMAFFVPPPQMIVALSVTALGLITRLFISDAVSQTFVGALIQGASSERPGFASRLFLPLR